MGAESKKSDDKDDLAHVQRLIKLIETSAIDVHEMNGVAIDKLFEFTEVAKLGKIHYEAVSDLDEKEIIPYKKIKPYRNGVELKSSPVVSRVKSALFIAGSLITAAADAATYVLGYGGGVIPALTVNLVAICIAGPLALIGITLRIREYKNIKSDIDVIVENDRELYRQVLSNEIVNIKRLNHALKNNLEPTKKINRDQLVEIIVNIKAIQQRLQQFKPHKNDKKNISDIKNRVRSVYASGEKLAELELYCATNYLEKICTNNGFDYAKITRKVQLNHHDSCDVHRNNNSIIDRVWKYLLPFAYAVGTTVTITYMLGFAAVLATPIGGALAIAGAITLAIFYKKLESKFAKIQASVSKIKENLDQHKLIVNESFNSMFGIKRIYKKLSPRKSSGHKPCSDQKDICRAQSVSLKRSRSAPNLFSPSRKHDYLQTQPASAGAVIQHKCPGF